MNKLTALAIALTAALGFLTVEIAEAKRMGGGKSFGAQRQATPPPSAPSAAPVAPAAPMQSAAAAKAAPAAATGASRWMGPLAGLAAGLGLAALLSHFGLSEGFANILLIMLLVMAAVFAFRFFMARRSAPRSPLQYAGAGGGLGKAPGGYETQVPPPISGGKSATDSGAFAPVFGGSTSTAAEPVSAPRFPPGFDPAPFADQSKQQFRRLQAAYDTADRTALAEVMTPDMFAAIAADLSTRGVHEATVIDSLDAEVLKVETEGSSHWASVRFTGSLREDGTLLGKPIDEVWNLIKPVDGSSGWLLAGIQQLA